jgi:hypothetical protein
MTTLEELEKLLAIHGANMQRVQAAIDGNYRLPTEDELEMRFVQDDLRSAAINALPALLESARRVERLEAALEFYAAREHYNDDPLPNNMWKTAKAVFDGGKRARAALKGT